MKNEVLNNLHKDYWETLDQNQKTKRELISELKNLYSRMDNLMVMFKDHPNFFQQKEKLTDEIKKAESSFYRVLEKEIEEGR